MVTKSQIKNWVLAVKSKARESVKKEHEEKVTQIKDCLLDKYGISHQLAEMQLLSNKLAILMDDLEVICDESKEISVAGYSHGLEDVIGRLHNIRALFINRSSRFDSSKLVQEDKRYQEKLSNVDSNYASVLAMVNILSPKKAIEYLKELGFDTSSIEEPVKQELAVINVDKRYLFVCGDNK